MATPKDLWATPRYGACSTCTCGCVWICHVRMCDPLHWSYVLQVCPQVLSCNACVLCVRACGATGNTSVTAWANACEGLLARHNKADRANKASKCERACGAIVRSCERAGNVSAGGERECGPTKGKACVRTRIRRRRGGYGERGERRGLRRRGGEAYSSRPHAGGRWRASGRGAREGRPRPFP